MKRSRSILTLVLSIAVLLPAAPALGASLVADYQLDDSFTSTVPGAPPLTQVGSGAITFATDDASAERVAVFPAGAGLGFKPSGADPDPSDYSVMFTYEHDALSGFQRLIQFEPDAAASDDGLYSYSDKLDYYDSGHSGDEFEGPAGVLQPNVYADLTLTRAASGDVKVYLGDAQQLMFNDALGSSVIGSDGLRFFKDDGTEQEAGSVARIRVFDGALSPPEIATVRSMGGFAATATVTGKLRLQPRKAKKAKKVSPGITVSCPPEGVSCPVSVAVGSLKKMGRFASRKGKVPKVLGSSSLSIGAGETVALPPVKLTRRARKAIKRKGRIKAQASVEITPYSKRPEVAVNNGKL